MADALLDEAGGLLLDEAGGKILAEYAITPTSASSRAVVNAGTGTTKSWTCPAPANLREGQLLLAFVYVASGGATINTPAGWTAAAPQHSVASSGNMLVLTKRVTAAEQTSPPTDYTFSGAHAGGTTWYPATAILQLPYADNVAAIQFAGTATQTTGHDAPSVAGVEGLLLTVFGAFTPAPMVSGPAGMTLRTSALESGQEGIYVYDVQLAGAGATGVRTATSSPADHTLAVSVVVAELASLEAENAQPSGAGNITTTSTLSGAFTPRPAVSAGITTTSTLAGAGAPRVDVSAGITTTSTLTSSGTARPAAAGAISSSSTLTGAGAPTPAGAATITTSTTLQGSGVATQANGGQGNVDTTTTLQAATAPATAGQGAITSSSTLTSAGVARPAGAGNITTTSTLAGTGAPRPAAAGNITTTSTLAGAFAPRPAAAGAITTTSSLSALASVHMPGLGAITCTSTLTGDGVHGAAQVTGTQYEYLPRRRDDFGRPAVWRYLAQDILTGAWLHWDLPLKRDELRWDLSGPGSLRATITPERPELLDSAGEFLLQEWRTAIYAEANGAIRWGGLVTRVNYDGPAANIEAAGFTAYPAGIEYDGPYYAKIQHDPTDIFRAIWTYLQLQPDGDLGLEYVLPGDCPVRIGKPAVAGYLTYKAADGKFYTAATWPGPGRIVYGARSELAANVTAAATTLQLTVLDKFDQVPNGSLLQFGNETIKMLSRNGLVLTVQRGQDGSSATAHSKGLDVVFNRGTEQEAVEPVPAEPYVLSYWDRKDLGAELDQLAAETPFDYAEEHYWRPDGTVGHRLRVDYPRLGTKRELLSFVQGVNVTNVVQATRNGDTFANAAAGIGKGEGATTVRVNIAYRDGRLRRPATYVDKGEARTDRLTAATRSELTRRRLAISFASITVRDHPNAPMASWHIGDDIKVTADLPWLGHVELWHRITSWAMEGEHTAVLTLQRSDSFTYGRPAATS